jgi:hypothetical protein
LHFSRQQKHAEPAAYHSVGQQGALQDFVLLVLAGALLQFS